MALPRLTGPNVVLGLMRIADKTDDEIRSLITTARDAGIDFFDHADGYGSRLHQCEEPFADAMQLTPSQRSEITLQTKAGIVPDGPYFDFSYQHLVSSAEASLRKEIAAEQTTSGPEPSSEARHFRTAPCSNDSSPRLRWPTASRLCLPSTTLAAAATNQRGRTSAA